ncbi:hypothetical protein Plhal304r1_c011g0042941 [Plasmopara halstedii]
MIWTLSEIFSSVDCSHTNFSLIASMAASLVLAPQQIYTYYVLSTACLFVWYHWD